MANKFMQVGLVISSRLSKSVKKSTTQASKHHKKLGGVIGAVNAKFSNVKSARKYGRVLNDLKRKQRTLGNTSERLNHRIGRAERRYRDARRAAAGYGTELDKLNSRQRKLNKSNQPDKSAIGRRVGMVGGAVLGASIGGSMIQGRSRSYLQTVINAKDGNRAAAALRSRREARKFARDKRTIATEKEVYEIEYIMNSAGLEEQASRAGARIGHKVATVTKGAGADVGNIIGGIYKQFGDDFEGSAEKKMGQIGNILTHVQLKYKIKNFDQLGQGLKEASSQANAMKITMVDTATVIGILNNEGMEAGRAGTAFNAAFRNMSKAGDELGFSMTRTKDGMLDVPETLQSLASALDGLDVDERADILRKIFGDEGMKGIIPILKNVADLNSEIADTMDKQNSNLLNERYAIIAEDDLANLQRFKEHIIGIGTGIGNALLPPINFVLGGINMFLGGLGAIIDKVPAVGFVIGAVASAVIGLGAVMATSTALTWAWQASMMFATNRHIIGFVGALTKGLWGLATRALPAVIIGARALGAALLANPIVAIVGAVAIGAVLIIKHWKPIKAFFGRIWTGIREPLMTAFNLFKRVFAFSPIGLVIAGFGKLPNVFKGVFGKVKALVKGAMDAVKSYIMAPLKAVGDLWNKLKGLGRKSKHVVGSVVAGAALVSSPVSASTGTSGTRPPFPPPPPPPTAPAAGAGQASPSQTLRQGDMHFHLDFSGAVGDARAFAEQLKPELERIVREAQEGNLHD